MFCGSTIVPMPTVVGSVAPVTPAVEADRRGCDVRAVRAPINQLHNQSIEILCEPSMRVRCRRVIL